jgi:hypothetical protein
MNIELMKENGARGANPLRKLAELGQSVWLDYIRQSLLSSGELHGLIHDDGLREGIPRGISPGRCDPCEAEAIRRQSR